MKSHKDMDVWTRAVEFAEYIYKITQCYPEDEKYGLVSQVRRSAVSISANIAEGASRRTTREFIQFLHLSRSSASELDTLLEISRRTYMTDTQVIEKAREKNIVIMEMLTALIKNLYVKNN